MQILRFSSLSTVGSVGLLIPILCALIAQFMQHIYAVDYDATKFADYNWYSPLFLFSFVKIFAIAVLAIHFARFLLLKNSPHLTVRSYKQADNYLLYILALNVVLALFLLTSIGFINSENFGLFLEMGVTTKIGKIFLVVVLLLLFIPLNNRLFKDLSFAIGSNVIIKYREEIPLNSNSVFLKSITINSLKYISPLYLIHLFLTSMSAEVGQMFFTVVLLDSIFVVALAMCAGYSIYRSHQEVLPENILN